MKRQKTTKKALLSSILSLILCLSMLIGTTFAWFTDSVTSANNIIKSGNLNVELEYSTDLNTWKPVTNTTNIFKEGALWEPGYTEVIYLRVSNLGSLALKYNLGVNIVSEKEGVNQAGTPFKLSDYIEFGVEEDVTTKYADRASAVAAVSSSSVVLNQGYTKNGSLLAGASPKVLAMVVYMPETVGNDANHNGTVPEITLGINLFATQFSNESDSFNEFYDYAAPWTGTVDATWYDANETEFAITSADELAGLAQLVNAGNTFEGKTIKLTANLDLMGLPFEAIGESNLWSGPFVDIGRPSPGEIDDATAEPFSGVFDGQGYTIRNINAVGENCVGLFGLLVGATVKDVTLENVTSKGYAYVGTLAGVADNRVANTIEDITVKGKIQVDGSWMVGGLFGRADATTISGVTIDAADGSYVKGTYLQADLEGDSVGGAIGQVAGSVTVDNISVKNLTVSGSRKVGGAFGMVNAGVTVSDISVESCEVNCIASRTYCNNNAGKIIVGGAIGEYQTITANNISVKYSTIVGKDPAKTGTVFGGTRNSGVLTANGTVDINNTLKIAKEVESVAAAQTALDNAVAGDIIDLPAGDYGTLVVKTDDVVVRGDGNTKVDYIDLNAAGAVVIEGIVFDAADAKLVGSYYTNITDESWVGEPAANGVVVRNCKFVGTASDVSKYIPICVENGSRSNAGAKNWTIDNCKFECNAFNYIRLDYLEAGTVNITNNTFGGTAVTTGHHAINMSGNSSNVVLSGNKFINWRPEKTAFATGRHTGYTGIVDIKINGNTFSPSRSLGTGDDGVIEIKTNSYNTANCTVDISGNTYAGGLEGKTDTTVRLVNPFSTEQKDY